MNVGNNFGRLLCLLLLGLLAGLGMYYLPSHIGAIKIKRVDLLSDLRENKQTSVMDSLRIQLQQEDSVTTDTLSIYQETIPVSDSIKQFKRDSLYNLLNEGSTTDSLGLRFEDYSAGHTGLQRFFSALNKREQLNRPVRIAFLGDSFIEGDILVGDFRALMQRQFGGRGVGFVPIASVAAMYRPTVEIKESGWSTTSILNDSNAVFTLSGMLFDAQQDPTQVSVKMSNRYPDLATSNRLSFIYAANQAASFELITTSDTLTQKLPITNRISEYMYQTETDLANFTFRETDGLTALGVVLEDNKGVSVDNYALRGNSGMPLMKLNASRCEEWNEIRPYDLIVLQYGLNVVSDSMMNYGWYTRRMEEVIRHIQTCFPESDLLLLSVSDRANQADGAFSTMPEILAMVHAQRRLARRMGIPFWNLFGAMGGENSMVQYVENNWASKDYTHLSFRGGKEIATLLMNALMQEKRFYDEAEKLDQ